MYLFIYMSFTYFLALAGSSLMWDLSPQTGMEAGPQR